MHLYEAHLPVADTSAAQRFYIEIVGSQFAHHDLTRDIVFLWADANRKSMPVCAFERSSSVRYPQRMGSTRFSARQRTLSSALRLTAAASTV